MIAQKHFNKIKYFATRSKTVKYPKEYRIMFTGSDDWIDIDQETGEALLSAFAWFYMCVYRVGYNTRPNRPEDGRRSNWYVQGVRAQPDLLAWGDYKEYLEHRARQMAAS